MRGLPAVALAMMILDACGSCGGSQLPHSDRTPVPVRFTITNDTDATVYLASQDGCGFGPLTIGDLGLYSGQSLSCERVKEPRPCPTFGSCAGAGVRPLAPGESWTVDWAGTHDVRASVDPGEVGEGCPSDCVVTLAADAGTYPVRIEAYDHCEGEGCACELEGDYASCHPDEPYRAAPELSAEAQFLLPESASAPVEVELRFR